MAKLGEGDARWLVTDLGAAGRNVNNFHWTERDALDWSRERLSALFTGMQLVGDGGEGSAGAAVQVTGLDSLEGEAFLNIR